MCLLRKLHHFAKGTIGQKVAIWGFNEGMKEGGSIEL